MRRLTREGPFASKPRLDVGECLVGSCKHLPVEGGRHSDPGRAWEQVRPETLTAAPKHHSLAVAPEKDQHAGLGPPGGVRGVGASWHEGRPDRQRHERSGSLLLPGFSHSGKSCQEAELKRGSSLYMCHTELAVGLMSPWTPPPRLPLCPLSLALTSCGSGASRLALCAERIQAPVGWVGCGVGGPGREPLGAASLPQQLGLCLAPCPARSWLWFLWRSQPAVGEQRAPPPHVRDREPHIFWGRRVSWLLVGRDRGDRAAVVAGASQQPCEELSRPGRHGACSSRPAGTPWAAGGQSSAAALSLAEARHCHPVASGAAAPRPALQLTRPWFRA